MVFKQGTNKKTGKPWAGWFCSDRECPQEPQWERSSSGNEDKLDRILKGVQMIYQLLNGKNNSQRNNSETEDWGAGEPSDTF